MRESGHRARLVPDQGVSPDRRGRLHALRRPHRRPLPEIRQAFRPAPNPRPAQAGKSISLKAGTPGWLAALCSSRLLAATWFVAYSAVLPLTQAEWGLSGREAGMVQAAFHLGYLLSL